MDINTMSKYSYQWIASKLSFRRSGHHGSFAVSDAAHVQSVAAEGIAPRKGRKLTAIFNDNYADTAPAQYEGVITKDIVIEGSIHCGSNLKISGVVKGDVICKGNVDITNQVKGNISGRQVFLFDANITGNVTAVDSIRHERGVINGSLKAQNADIDGVVNGDICVGELVNIRKNAVINGDIHASMVSIAKKAVINGKLCVCTEE